MAIISLMLFSCNISTSNKDTDNQTGKEYTSDYICPMHCEGSGSNEPGTCPVCKMDYVKNETNKTTSEKEYACPMHPEITGKKGDTCSKCHMDLEKIKTEHTH